MQRQTATAVQVECPFAVLPESVQEDILLRTALHARQACRAFRALRPVRSIAPHGGETPEQLTAAIAALHPSIACLDLRKVDRSVISPGTLAAIPDALPQLQHLALPNHTNGIASALHRLPHLHTLHAPAAPLPRAALLQPPTATRLRALTCRAFATFHAAPPGAFPHLSSITFSDSGERRYDIHGAQLASLLGPVPAYRRLSVHIHTHRAPELHEPEQLTALTTLTALSLHRLQPSSTSKLLHALAVLTSLRSLTLDLDRFPKRSARPDGPWLSGLTLLTHFRVMFAFACFPSGRDLQAGPLPVQAGIISQLVQGAAALPQLQQLQLGFFCHSGGCAELAPLSWLASGIPHSFFRLLAAATQLRQLGLCGLPLPPVSEWCELDEQARHFRTTPSEACMLSQLQGLTSLRLGRVSLSQAVADRPSQPGRVSRGLLSGLPDPTVVTWGQWVAALTELRELHIQLCGQHVTWHLLQAVATLPQLHTLALRDLGCSSTDAAVSAACLLQLLTSLGHLLVRLDLGGTWAAWDRGILRALGSMSRLHVLSLYCPGNKGQYSGSDMVLPPSLQRCYLPVDKSGDGVEALRVRYPAVAFKLHDRPNDGEW